MNTSAQTKKKRPMSQAAIATLSKSQKCSKQYIVHVLGLPAAVTFGNREHTRVKAEAARLKLSVEDLIVRVVERFAARRRRSQEDSSALISRAVADLGALRTRSLAR